VKNRLKILKRLWKKWKMSGPLRGDFFWLTLYSFRVKYCLAQIDVETAEKSTWSLAQEQQMYRPDGRDDKPSPLARQCCIMTNSGALCRIQVKRNIGDRQTDRQTGRTLNNIRPEWWCVRNVKAFKYFKRPVIGM